MPFVLAGDLGLFAAAMLLMLLAIAVSYLVRAIAAALPRIDFAFVHIDFGAIFLAVAQPVASWLTTAALNLFHTAEAWMRAIAYTFVGLFDEVKNAIGTLFSHVDHVVGTTIPQAISHATGHAAAYVDQEIAALRREITNSASTFATDIGKAGAKELAKSEALVKSAGAAAVVIGAKAISTSEDYADAEIAKLKAYVDGAIGAIHLPNLESIGAAPAALVGTVAGVAAAVAAITSEFESCAVTSCDGPNNLSNLLNGILGFAGLAELGAFLADVINNPASAEQEYASVLQGLIGAGTSAFDDLLAL